MSLWHKSTADISLGKLTHRKGLHPQMEPNQVERQKYKLKTRHSQLPFIFVCLRMCLKFKLPLLLSSDDLLFVSVLDSVGNVGPLEELVGVLLFSPANSLAKSWNFFTKSTLFSSIIACNAVSG